MKALVIGYGSIGKRHADNLIELSHEVSVVETDENKITQLKEEGYNVYLTIEEAFRNESFDMVFICTPTVYHIPQAQYVVLHDIKGLFIEKPLSYNTMGIDTLVNVCKEKNIHLMCGCNLRYSSGIRLIRMILLNQTIGDVYYITYNFGHDLRKWHPDTSDYTKSYSAGEHGGIALDDIHALDLIQFLVGEFSEVTSHFSSSGTLNISQEDSVDHLIKHNYSKTVSHVHSDYISPEYTRTLEIYGTNGYVQWDFGNGFVYLKTPEIDGIRTFGCAEPLNEMYIRELSDFIHCVEHDKKPQTDGVYVLKQLIKAKEKIE